MILYDGNHILLDVLVFFFVGRLYRHPGVDCLTWIFPTLFSSMALLSGASNLPALKHSITSYEIHCLWGWQMWTLILLVAIPLLVGLVGVHLVYAFSQIMLARKLTEVLFCFALFLGPFVSSPFFHLHHWYYACYPGIVWVRFIRPMWEIRWLLNESLMAHKPFGIPT